MQTHHALASALPFLLSLERKSDEKEALWLRFLTFAREWSKWYCVLRHHKGFRTARFRTLQPLAGAQLIGKPERKCKWFHDR